MIGDGFLLAKLNLKKLPEWQRNLAVLWLGCFVAGVGFSEIAPFLSLYVEQLGSFDKSTLSLYSGITYAVTFFCCSSRFAFMGKIS